MVCSLRHRGSLETQGCTEHAWKPKEHTWKNRSTLEITWRKGVHWYAQGILGNIKHTVTHMETQKHIGVHRPHNDTQDIPGDTGVPWRRRGALETLGAQGIFSDMRHTLKHRGVPGGIGADLETQECT